MNSTSSHLGWGFWGRWLAATTIGWIAGTIGAVILSYLVVNPFYPKETNLILGICVGAAVGFAQRIAVRGKINLGGRWVWGAMVGVGIPFVLAVLVDELWPGSSELSGGPDPGWLIVALAGGVIAGLLQLPALRPLTPKASWWTYISVLSWGLAWLAMKLMGLMGFLVGGILLGGVSGGMLIILLKMRTGSDGVQEKG